MKNKNSLISILILSVFLLTGVEITFACTPNYRIPQESFSSVDLVFSGKVISIATSTQAIVYDGTNVPTKISAIGFKVEKYWKGNPTEYLIVKSTAPDGYSCPILVPKSLGSEYLVYANKDTSSNSYFVNYTEIKEIASANADLVLLGNGLKVSTEVKIETDTIKPISKPTESIETVPVVKTSSVVVPISDSQSNTNEVQVNTEAEVKQNFIQKILSWFRNLFR